MSRYITFGLLDETNEERDPVFQQAYCARQSALKSRIPTGHEIKRQADIVPLRLKVASGTCLSAFAGISHCSASSGF